MKQDVTFHVQALHGQRQNNDNYQLNGMAYSAVGSFTHNINSPTT